MNDHYLRHLLGDNEQVLLVTRQHWFVLFRAILFELIFALIIIGGVTALWLLVLPLAPVWLGYFLLIVPIIGFLQDYIAWYNRKYIITTWRVMQLSGVFNKNVIDSSLEKVNDVKLDQSFWGRLFNFGDIEILTASELGVNQFHTIGEPIRFKTTMLNAKEALDLDQDHHHPARAKEDNSDDIPALIEQLDQLRKKGILSEDEFQIKKQELLSKL